MQKVNRNSASMRSRPSQIPRYPQSSRSTGQKAPNYLNKNPKSKLKLPTYRRPTFSGSRETRSSVVTTDSLNAKDVCENSTLPISATPSGRTFPIVPSNRTISIEPGKSAMPAEPSLFEAIVNGCTSTANKFGTDAPEEESLFVKQSSCSTLMTTTSEEPASDNVSAAPYEEVSESVSKDSSYERLTQDLLESLRKKPERKKSKTSSGPAREANSEHFFEPMANNQPFQPLIPDALKEEVKALSKSAYGDGFHDAQSNEESKATVLESAPDGIGDEPLQAQQRLREAQRTYKAFKEEEQQIKFELGQCIESMGVDIQSLHKKAINCSAMYQKLLDKNDQYYNTTSRVKEQMAEKKLLKLEEANLLEIKADSINENEKEKIDIKKSEKMTQAEKNTARGKGYLSARATVIGCLGSALAFAGSFIAYHQAFY